MKLSAADLLRIPTGLGLGRSSSSNLRSDSSRSPSISNEVFFNIYWLPLNFTYIRISRHETCGALYDKLRAGLGDENYLIMMQTGETLSSDLTDITVADLEQRKIEKGEKQCIFVIHEDYLTIEQRGSMIAQKTVPAYPIWDENTHLEVADKTLSRSLLRTKYKVKLTSLLATLSNVKTRIHNLSWFINPIKQFCLMESAFTENLNFLRDRFVKKVGQEKEAFEKELNELEPELLPGARSDLGSIRELVQKAFDKAERDVKYFEFQEVESKWRFPTVHLEIYEELEKGVTETTECFKNLRENANLEENIADLEGKISTLNNKAQCALPRLISELVQIVEVVRHLYEQYSQLKSCFENCPTVSSYYGVKERAVEYVKLLKRLKRIHQEIVDRC